MTTETIDYGWYRLTETKEIKLDRITGEIVKVDELEQEYMKRLKV